MKKCDECGIYFQENEEIKTCPICSNEMHPECYNKFHTHIEEVEDSNEVHKEEKIEDAKELVEHELEGETIPFVPDHILSEVTTMLLIIVLLSLLVIFVPTPLEQVANPFETPAEIKPEWYFLFLFAFLHFVPTIVGIFAPLVGVVFLILLPWIDKNPSRKLKDRKVAIIVTVILLIAILILSYIGEFGV